MSLKMRSMASMLALAFGATFLSGTGQAAGPQPEPPRMRGGFRGFGSFFGRGFRLGPQISSRYRGNRNRFFGNLRLGNRLYRPYFNGRVLPLLRTGRTFNRRRWETSSRGSRNRTVFGNRRFGSRRFGISRRRGIRTTLPYYTRGRRLSWSRRLSSLHRLNRSRRGWRLWYWRNRRRAPNRGFGIVSLNYYNPYGVGAASIDSQSICQAGGVPDTTGNVPDATAGTAGNPVPGSDGGVGDPGIAGSDGSGVPGVAGDVGNGQVDGSDPGVDGPPVAGNVDGDAGVPQPGNVGDDGSPVAGDETSQPSPLDQAVSAFQQQDFATAQRQIALAAQGNPNSGDVHQMRSLISFARKDYRSAAAAAHKALSGDAPWQSAQLKLAYGSWAPYTRGLRALESYVGRNPSAKAARFLLAYHYLMLHQKAAARHVLKRVVALQPRDQLAASLLTALDKQTN